MTKQIQSIEDITLDQQNANKGTVRGRYMLEQSLRQLGGGRSVVVDANGNAVAGNKTLETAADIGLDIQVVPSDGTKLLVVQRTDWDLENPQGNARKYALMDNRISEVDYELDEQLLAQFVIDGADVTEMYQDDELDDIIGQALKETKEDTNESQEDDLLSSQDIPDAVFPSQDVWGIPLLDINMQAQHVEMPINTWGSLARNAQMTGTYHFYTDDYRFDGLWKDPSGVINSECAAICEPNFSTNVQMPRAVALWHTYRKRWMARYWQEHGIRTFVDLDVCDVLMDINLMGVPKGWRSYSFNMRPSDHDLCEIHDTLKVAQEHAQSDDVLLLIIGGEQAARDECLKYPQCMWMPSFVQQAVRGDERWKSKGTNG